MPKNRVLYNTVGVFAGTCPSTGYHFLDYSGNYVNSTFCSGNGLGIGFSQNLIYPLLRIIGADYGLSEVRDDIRSMGQFGTLARPIIINPPINLNLSYSFAGLSNELILGFNLSSGSLACPISGMLDRSYQIINNGNTITQINRDAKNIFIVTRNDLNDLNTYQPIIQNLNGTTGSILNQSEFTYAFGDCYLDSWRLSAEVLQFPTVQTSFTCHNIMYQSGSSGNNIPSVFPVTDTIRTGIIYNLPPVYTGIQATILLPGSMTLNISEAGGNNNLNNLPLSATDIKIQKFDIDLSLNREPLYNVGYRLPMDRVINPPIYSTLSISSLAGDSLTGSFINFLNNDTTYNISITMNYTNQPVTGVGASFSFLGAKFDKYSISDAVSQNRTIGLSFTTEINPNNLSQGFFISGQAGNNIKLLV